MYNQSLTSSENLTFKLKTPKTREIVSMESKTMLGPKCNACIYFCMRTAKGVEWSTSHSSAFFEWIGAYIKTVAVMIWTLHSTTHRVFHMDGYWNFSDQANIMKYWKSNFIIKHFNCWHQNKFFLQIKGLNKIHAKQQYKKIGTWWPWTTSVPPKCQCAYQQNMAARLIVQNWTVLLSSRSF